MSARRCTVRFTCLRILFQSLTLYPGVTQGSVEWIPAINTCLITRTDRFRLGITVNFITEEILLGVMIAGVLNKRNTTGLWRVLYIQVCPYYRVTSPSSMYSTSSGSFLGFCCIFIGSPTYRMSSSLFSKRAFSDTRFDRHLVG